MKSSAVAAALGIAKSTVRKYAAEYAEFLTPTAAGDGRRHRNFADQDVKVLQLVCELKRKNADPQTIVTTLATHQRNGWEGLPPFVRNPRQQFIPPSPGESVEPEKMAMQREIELLHEQLARLNAAREAERSAHDVLLQRLYRAETLVELYESGRLKPNE